jgi:membrane-bound ClpP family serine protease
MLLAIETMDPIVQGIFFLVAVILFVLAGVGTRLGNERVAGGVALGLAFFAFPFMYNAFAAA